MQKLSYYHNPTAKTKRNKAITVKEFLDAQSQTYIATTVYLLFGY